MSKPIHYAIDGNEANIANRVGSNVYAFEIITAMEKDLRDNDDVKVTVLLRSKPLADMPSERDGWKYMVVGPKKLWTQWALPLHLFVNKSKYDLLFSPGHYAPHLCPIPYVSSVMDTAYLDYPEYFQEKDRLQLKNWTQKSVAKAEKVIVISEATKEAVINNYQRKKGDVIVAYPGYKNKNAVLDDDKKDEFFEKHSISEPYILFVGTIQPRKNIIRMVEAFEIFSRMIAGRTLKSKKSRRKSPKLKPAKLVLAGKIGWLAEDILQRIFDSPMKHRIIRTGFITEEEKGTLYKHAKASILVGLYEGFGIPPLESLSYNTPPIVSNTSSLPEVVGDAGFQADPQNPQDIADALWEAYTMNKSDKAAFEKRARKQLDRFSWDKSASTILETLREVVNNKPNE